MESRLTIRIEGPGVQQGKIALKDLQRIVHPLEQAVRALLPATEPAEQPGGRARKPQVRFLLVGSIGKGSATADLELDTSINQSLPSLEPDPLSRLVEGLGRTEEHLPTAAHRPIDRMAQHLPPGVDSVEIAVRGSDVRCRITRQDLGEPAKTLTGSLNVSGRLMAVDFEKGRAVLRVPQANPRSTRPRRIRLRFPDQLAGDMQSYARQLVTVEGIAEMDSSDEIRSLEVLRMYADYDDRRAMWAPKLFTWPAAEDRIENVDIEAFLREAHGVDEDDE